MPIIPPIINSQIARKYDSHHNDINMINARIALSEF